MDAPNAYSTLELHRNCTLDEVKKAHRKLALKYHPDKRRNVGNDDDNKRFDDIQKAYEYLVSVKKFESRVLGTTERDLPAQRQQLPQNEYDLKLSLEEIYQGCTKTQPITRRIVDQHGLEVREESQIKVKVDCGSIDGTKIILTESGDREYGKIAANVIFIVRELPHAIFTRIRFDLEYTKRISIEDACKGEVELRCLDKKSFKWKVNEIISKNTVLRVPNRGMPILNGSGKCGDLVVKFEMLPVILKDPPIYHNIIFTSEQLKTGCIKKIRITRSVAEADGTERDETKILVLEIKPGTRVGRRLVFPKEGDQKVGSIPADVIVVVRNENFGKQNGQNQHRRQNQPQNRLQNQSNLNISRTNLNASQQNLTQPSTTSGQQNRRARGNRSNSANRNNRQPNSNNNNNTKPKNIQNYKLQTLNEFQTQNPEFKIDNLKTNESQLNVNSNRQNRRQNFENRNRQQQNSNFLVNPEYSENRPSNSRRQRNRNNRNSQQTTNPNQQHQNVPNSNPNRGNSNNFRPRNASQNPQNPESRPTHPYPRFPNRNNTNNQFNKPTPNINNLNQNQPNQNRPNSFSNSKPSTFSTQKQHSSIPESKPNKTTIPNKPESKPAPFTNVNSTNSNPTKPNFSTPSTSGTSKPSSSFSSQTPTTPKVSKPYSSTQTPHTSNSSFFSSNPFSSPSSTANFNTAFKSNLENFNNSFSKPKPDSNSSSFKFDNSAFEAEKLNFKNTFSNFFETNDSIPNNSSNSTSFSPNYQNAGTSTTKPSTSFSQSTAPNYTYQDPFTRQSSASSENKNNSFQRSFYSSPSTSTSAPKKEDKSCLIS